MHSELGSSIQREFYGNRITVIVLKNLENNEVIELVQVMDKIHAKPRIVFCHQGRPSKVFRLLREWFKVNNLISSEFLDALEAKVGRADDLLYDKSKIIKADGVLYGTKS